MLLDPIKDLWGNRLVQPRPAALYFMQFSVLASVGRFTSLLFEEHYGLDEDHVGLVFGIGVFITLLAVPLGGVMADTHDDGMRKVLFHGNTLSTICWSLLAVWYPDSTQSRFYLIMVVFALRKMFSSSLLPVLDGYTMEYLATRPSDLDDDLATDQESIVQKRRSRYGGERLWGSIGWGLTSMLLGSLLDLTHGDYRVMFILLWISTCWMGWLLSLPVTTHVQGDMELTALPDTVPLRQEETNEYQVDATQSADGDVFMDTGDSTGGSPQVANKSGVIEFLVKVVTDLNTVVFLLAIVVMGAATSLIENLVFLFFVKTLGASYSMCGITVIITVVFEIPLLHYSSDMAKLGVNRLMAIAMFSYIVRVTVYTIADSSTMWIVLFVEPLHGVTFSTMALATVQEMSSIAPSHLQATAQSTVTFSRSIGTVLGVVGGSHLMQVSGSRTTYGVATVVVSVTLVLFLALRSRGGNALVEEQKESSIGYQEVAFDSNDIVET